MGFLVLVFLIISLSSFLCLYLPYICNRPKLGLWVSLISISIVLLVSFSGLYVFSILILFFLFVGQLIFIVYWIFIYYGKKKLSIFLTISILLGITFFISLPYLKEFFFNKKQARSILAFHHIQLQDDFEILNYEITEFIDFTESLKLKISENDFLRLSNEIKSSNNFSNYKSVKFNLNTFSKSNIDTLDYETSYHIQRKITIIDKISSKSINYEFYYDKADCTLRYTKFY